MVFNTLWTILLGIVGGIVSSLIVSRVFFVQGEYQLQYKFVEKIIRKLGYISAFLQSIVAIFKVSYDQNVEIEKEMKEKGYKNEAEYFAAHADKDWISKKDVFKVFHKEIDKAVQSIQDDLKDDPVNDPELNELLTEVMTYIHDVSSIKDYTFSQISLLKQSEKKLLDHYESCRNMSGKKLRRLVFKDKTMIILFIVVLILIVGTVAAYLVGI